MIRKTVTQTRAGAVQGYFTGQCLLFTDTPYAAPSSGGFAPRVPHDLSAFTARTAAAIPRLAAPQCMDPGDR
jgi:carboxylesterase type B